MGVLALPLGIYSAGVYRLSTFPVPTDAACARLCFDRERWGELDFAMVVHMDLSLDGGWTWDETRTEEQRAAAAPYPIASGSTGELDWAGRNRPVFLLGAGLPQVGNPYRRIRADFAIDGASIVTHAELFFQTFAEMGVPITVDNVLGSLRVAA